MKHKIREVYHDYIWFTLSLQALTKIQVHCLQNLQKNMGLVLKVES